MFFFKQKTAYEIKECDWSSDVCSSDLKKAFRANSQLMPVNDKTDMSNAFISFAFDIDNPSTLGIQLYPRVDPGTNGMSAHLDRKSVV